MKRCLFFIPVILLLFTSCTQKINWRSQVQNEQVAVHFLSNDFISAEEAASIETRFIESLNKRFVKQNLLFYKQPSDVFSPDEYVFLVEMAQLNDFIPGTSGYTTITEKFEWNTEKEEYEHVITSTHTKRKNSMEKIVLLCMVSFKDKGSTEFSEAQHFSGESTKTAPSWRAVHQVRDHVADAFIEFVQQ